MYEAFDAQQPSAEEDWRTLAKFGVERNEEFDMDEEFGPVVAGDVEGVIELKSAPNRVATHDLHVSIVLYFICFMYGMTCESHIYCHINITLIDQKPIHGLRRL